MATLENGLMFFGKTDYLYRNDPDKYVIVGLHSLQLTHQILVFLTFLFINHIRLLSWFLYLYINIHRTVIKHYFRSFSTVKASYHFTPAKSNFNPDMEWVAIRRGVAIVTVRASICLSLFKVHQPYFKRALEVLTSTVLLFGHNWQLLYIVI